MNNYHSSRTLNTALAVPEALEIFIIHNVTGCVFGKTVLTATELMFVFCPLEASPPISLIPVPTLIAVAAISERTQVSVLGVSDGLINDAPVSVELRRNCQITSLETIRSKLSMVTLIEFALPDPAGKIDCL